MAGHRFMVLVVTVMVTTWHAQFCDMTILVNAVNVVVSFLTVVLWAIAWKARLVA